VVKLALFSDAGGSVRLMVVKDYHRRRRVDSASFKDFIGGGPLVDR